MLLKNKYWVVFALILMAPLTQAMSGEDLYRYCADHACGGYFVGAFDSLRIAGAVGNERQKKITAICPPDDIDDEAIVEVALDYLERHAEVRYLSAANLALRAWREQWPCSAKH